MYQLKPKNNCALVRKMCVLMTYFAAWHPSAGAIPLLLCANLHFYFSFLLFLMPLR